jgi:hypothetical protein
LKSTISNTSNMLSILQNAVNVTSPGDSLDTTLEDAFQNSDTSPSRDAFAKLRAGMIVWNMRRMLNEPKI